MKLAKTAAHSKISCEGGQPPPSDLVTTHVSAGPPAPTGAARGPTGWGFVSLINRLDGTCSGGLSISSHDQGRMQAEEVRQAPIGIRAYYSSMRAYYSSMLASMRAYNSSMCAYYSAMRAYYSSMLASMLLYS